MLNIIREDCQFNADLDKYPSANANIAIFGTQSSGKSTLLNNVFGTKFPVLDTSITRERCTKGVWFHNISNFNVIDTQGFDSEERDAHQKIFQKQVALFCLALSDVLIINMWMDQIGRYEASHSHVLRAIIKASEKLIAKQQRKIIFVVRDCTDDADRSVLSEELNSQMMTIVKAETKKSNIRFTLDYFMMSHFFDSQKEFKKEAKELLKLIQSTRKSNMSNYTDEDRFMYVKNLWHKVTTDEQIDLRTAEDALRNYALERVKRQTVNTMENWLDSVTDLQQYKSYQRFKEGAARQARICFLEGKPKHLKQKDAQPFIQAIFQILDSRQNKHFMTVILPAEENRLIEQYKKKVQIEKGSDVLYFKRNMERRNQQTTEHYQNIVKGLQQHAKIKKRFAQKLNHARQEYVQYLEHLQSVFKTELQTVLNQQVDQQTKKLCFDGSRIRKLIQITEEKHHAQVGPELNDIWDSIIQRTSLTTIVLKIKSQGQKFSDTGIGNLIGNQTQDIIDHYHDLQKKAQKYIQNLTSFLTAEEQTTTSLQKVDSIRRLISQIIQAKINEESKRFKITLLFIVLLMFFFYGEFRLIMKLMGVGRRRLNKWLWLYIATMVGMVGVSIYKKRSYFQNIIEEASS